MSDIGKNMFSILIYILVFIAGGAAAALYVFLLHLSVKNITNNSVFSPLVILGFIFRLLLCGGCFILVSWGGHFDRLLICVAGFTIVRLALINKIKSSEGIFKIKVKNNDNKS